MRVKTHCIFGIGLLAITCLALTPNAALAVLIAATDFLDDGSDGSIAGDTSGTGWSTEGWTAQDTMLGGSIVPSSMTYRVPGGGTVSAASALQFTGSPLGSGVQRSLANPQSGDDVYISFLTKWESGEISSNDFVIWYFNSNGGPNIGYKADQGTAGGTLSGTDRLDFVARTTGSTNEYAPDPLVVGETYFVVGHLTKTVPGAANPYDRYELWVNPSFGDSGSPEGVSSGASSVSEITNVGVRTHQITADQSDDLRFGALRIGTTWSDVVPEGAGFIPEDINGDQIVDVSDFNILGENLYRHLDGLPTSDRGDVNLDGRIDLADVLQFKTNFPAVFAAATGVPEPSTIGLAMIALAGLLHRGRSRRGRC